MKKREFLKTHYIRQCFMLDIDWPFSTTEILSIQLGLFNRSKEKRRTKKQKMKTKWTWTEKQK